MSDSDYSWIKVKRFVDNPALSYEERFNALLEHHEAETKWLIAEVMKYRQRAPVIIAHANGYRFEVNWSEPDQEYVGTCNAYPSISHLDPDVDTALCGIQALVRDIEENEEA